VNDLATYEPLSEEKAILIIVRAIKFYIIRKNAKFVSRNFEKGSEIIKKQNIEHL
jgi:hypothetical protein